MKRFFSLFLLLSWPTSVGSQTGLLVKNGSFEMANPKGFPLYWSPVESEGPIQWTANLVERSPEEGYCLLLNVQSTVPWSMEGLVEGTLQENQSYLFSCEAMTGEGPAMAQINLYTEGGTLQDRLATLTITRASKWRTFRATVRSAKQTNLRIRIEAEDLLQPNDGWTTEREETDDRWVLTSMDFYSNLWTEGMVLRSPKEPRPKTLLPLRISNLLPGKYRLLFSDPGGTLEARWETDEWRRISGGKGEVEGGLVELEEGSLQLEIRTPPAGEATVLPCYLDYLRLLPDFEQSDRFVAKERPVSPPLQKPIDLVGRLTGKKPFLSVPISVGFPLPKGGVYDAQTVHLRTRKSVFPTQVEVLSSWPDNSLRWIMLRSVIPPDLWTASKFAVSFRGSAQQPKNPNRVENRDGLLRIGFGKLEQALDLTTGEISSLGVDRDGNGHLEPKEDLLGSPAYIRVETASTKGPLSNVLFSELQSHEIESKGPVYLRVRSEGTLSSLLLEQKIHYCLRQEFFAGIPGFRYELFLWSGQRESILSVLDVAWVFPLKEGNSHAYCFPTDSKHFMNGEVSSRERVILSQKEFNAYEISAATGASKETFYTGKGHPGWGSFACEAGYLVIQNDHFREMHPSSFQLRESEASIHFFPAEEAFGKPSYWFNGSGRTCSGWILVLDEEKPRDLKRWVDAATQWPVLTPSRTWVQRSLPTWKLPSLDLERFSLYERMVEFSFEQGMHRIETWDDTGFFDFGDHSLAKREQSAQWSNVRFALPHVLITEGFRRNCDERYFKRGIISALHQADVDMDHREGGVHPQGMGHALSPLRPKQGWARSHLDALHLQGSMRFYDASVSLGDWLLDLLSEDPVQLVLSCEDSATALCTLMDLYEETGEGKYWKGIIHLYAFIRRWQDQDGGLWYSPDGANPKVHSVQMDESANLLLALTELGDLAEVEGLEKVLSLAAEGLLHRVAHPQENDSPDLRRFPFFKIILAKAIGAASVSLDREDLAQRAMHLFDDGIQDGNFLGRDLDIFANASRETPRFLASAAEMNILPSGDKSLFFKPIHFGSLFVDKDLSFHPFSLAAPPDRWRLLILDQEDQPFEVTIYKERIGKGCKGEVFLEDVYRHLIERVSLEEEKNERITLKVPVDQQTGTYQVRILDQGLTEKEGNCVWSLSVNPSLPVVLEAPNTFRIADLESVRFFFQVPPEQEQLWCRIFLRKVGGIRAQFLGPDGAVLAKKEIITKFDPGPKPEWDDLVVVKLPPRDKPVMCQMYIQGTVDVLLQLKLASRYLCTDPAHYFEPEKRGPWEKK